MTEEFADNVIGTTSEPITPSLARDHGGGKLHVYHGVYNATAAQNDTIVFARKIPPQQRHLYSYMIVEVVFGAGRTANLGHKPSDGTGTADPDSILLNIDINSLGITLFNQPIVSDITTLVETDLYVTILGGAKGLGDLRIISVWAGNA